MASDDKNLRELLARWERRRRDALPVAAMLVNLHISELRDVLEVLEASRPAAPVAAPAPVTLGPLAERAIKDAIRSAYDQGYSDARNARALPGDGAPGYQGRTVESDLGGALLARLIVLTLRAAPHAAAVPETRDALAKRLIGEVLEADAFATAVCQRVAELPDRDSPEDWPEAMLVTHDELHMIVREAIIAAQQEGAAP